MFSSRNKYIEQKWRNDTKKWKKKKEEVGDVPQNFDTYMK